MSIDMTVLGIKQIMKNLTDLELGIKAENKIIDQSMKKGIKVIQKSIQSKVPVDSGDMRRAIVVRKKSRNRHRIYVEHTFKGQKARTKKKSFRDAWYWRFIEFGHFDRAGKWVRPAKPIRRGFAQSVQSAIKTFRNDFKIRVEKEMTRIGSRRIV